MPLDLDVPLRRKDETLRASEAKTKELHDTQAGYQGLLTAREHYAKLVEAGGQEAERFKAIASLSEAASGKNARRLSLQRYVLASLLDDVLAHASERLRVMSTGRYRVLRDEPFVMRQAGGLDLLIEDRTPESPSIATLSGARAAALALSLGLADVIKLSRAGYGSTRSLSTKASVPSTAKRLSAPSKSFSSCVTADDWWVSSRTLRSFVSESHRGSRDESASAAVPSRSIRATKAHAGTSRRGFFLQTNSGPARVPP